MRRRSPAATARTEQRAWQRHGEELLARWKSSLAPEFRGFTLRDVEAGWQGHLPRGAKAKLRNYLAEPSRVLLLRGTSGLGKSTLACTLLTELVRTTSRAAAYASTPQLLAAFSTSAESRTLDVAALTRVPYLLLDDVGAMNEGMTPHQARSLWGLLDERWREQRPTILTTNMAIADGRDGIGLRSWLGPSAWDRVADDLEMIELRGESLRGRELED